MRITKAIASEFAALAKKQGYWSQEVRNFLSQFDYIQVQKIHSKASEILGYDVTKF
jgi:hypothetical protein